MKMPKIAAHRGCAAGNIPCNTWIAFEAALACGADIVELDVTRCADGTLFVFHPGMEPAHLLSQKGICEMTADEVRGLRYVNMDHCATELGVSPLDDQLERLKDRCVINIDKFFEWPEEIAACVRRHGMQDQVIIKTNATEDWFRRVECVAPDLPYLAMTVDRDDFSESLRGRNLRYIGTEANFARDTAPVAQKAYMDRMHALGLIVWYNSIVFDYHAVLAGGHNDDVSVAGHPNDGWGWMLDREVDIIQTDWPWLLRQYMNQRSLK